MDLSNMFEDILLGANASVEMLSLFDNMSCASIKAAICTAIVSVCEALDLSSVDFAEEITRMIKKRESEE